MSSRAPRILLLPMADQQHGSSRLRAWQYVSYLEYVGFRVRTVNRIALPSGVAYGLAVLRKLAWCDLVFIQKRFLPGWLLRACRALGKKVVYDFDDTMHISRGGCQSPTLQAFHACLQNAAAVVAGNEYLADYAQRFSRHVIIVPTPVKALPFVARLRDGKSFVVGWIGSRTAIPDLRMIQGALREASRQLPEMVLKAISSEEIRLEGVRGNYVPWKLETADEELREADVGIMPVPDDPYGQGKCAYKALQCMSLGIPVVVSPVGMNREVVENGREGFWASSDSEWVEALRRLHDDPGLAARMAEAAHAKAQNYAVERCAERLVGLFREVLGHARP